MKKKTYIEKPFRNPRDIQIRKAVELSKRPNRPIDPKIRKPIGEEE